MKVSKKTKDRQSSAEVVASIQNLIKRYQSLIGPKRKAKLVTVKLIGWERKWLVRKLKIATSDETIAFQAMATSHVLAMAEATRRFERHIESLEHNRKCLLKVKSRLSRSGILTVTDPALTWIRREIELLYLDGMLDMCAVGWTFAKAECFAVDVVALGGKFQ